MPLYTWTCLWNHQFERFVRLEKFHDKQFCECGQPASRLITAPLMVTAQQECCYDSPIDGTPITSWRARRNDLAKHNCVPYDPAMKQDSERLHRERQQSLDRAIDETIESSIEKMSTVERGKLYSELTEQNMQIDCVRQVGA